MSFLHDATTANALEMENTGNVQIGYYEVYFRITCEDSSIYIGEGWDHTKH